MADSWHEVVGLIGVASILGAYGLLQAGRIHSGDLAYSIVNALGASCVLVSLWFAFNLSAFIVEAFWVLISLYGIGKALRRRRPEAEP
ncbi:MAG: hypothetical protein R2834_18520 [Rhodothermales bacterium]